MRKEGKNDRLRQDIDTLTQISDYMHLEFVNHLNEWNNKLNVRILSLELVLTHTENASRY